MKKLSNIGITIGAILGCIAILSGPRTQEAYLIAASIVFGSGLIAGAIEKDNDNK